METTKTSQNTLACIVAGIMGAAVSLRISRLFLTQYIPFAVLIGIAAIYLLGTIAYIFIWKRKAKQPGFDSQNILAFWQGVTRYFLALEMCMFGFQKIFHLQFIIHMALLDNPFSSLSGGDMLWAFFGHFYAYTLIIAGLQIGSSLLLLFRRTQLLGTILLLPVLINILLIDYFYNPGIVVDIYATLLTLVAIYLLLLDYNRLMEFFFRAKSNLPALNFKNRLLKNAIRFSVIWVPLLLIAMYKFPQYYPEVYGKYEVKSFTINGKLQDHSTCRDSVLTKIFIDNTDLVMEFNNYKERYIGDYKYDPATKQLTVIWHYPATMHDTLFVKVGDGQPDVSKVLLGKMGKNKVAIGMEKVEQ